MKIEYNIISCDPDVSSVKDKIELCYLIESDFSIKDGDKEILHFNFFLIYQFYCELKEWSTFSNNDFKFYPIESEKQLWLYFKYEEDIITISSDFLNASSPLKVNPIDFFKSTKELLEKLKKDLLALGVQSEML